MIFVSWKKRRQALLMRRTVIDNWFKQTLPKFFDYSIQDSQKCSCLQVNWTSTHEVANVGWIADQQRTRETIKIGENRSSGLRRGADPCRFFVFVQVNINPGFRGWWDERIYAKVNANLVERQSPSTRVYGNGLLHWIPSTGLAKDVFANGDALEVTFQFIEHLHIFLLLAEKEKPGDECIWFIKQFDSSVFVMEHHPSVKREIDLLKTVEICINRGSGTCKSQRMCLIDVVR